MTDDYREEIEADFADGDNAGDPAVAFDALRTTVESASADLTREMTTIRKGVEAAFDQLERVGTPTDYSADLGRIVQNLTVLSERLQAVEKSPLLRQGADQFAAHLERSGEGLVRIAAQKLETQASDLERIARNLSVHIDGARERSRQNWGLAGIGTAGVALGILFTLFAPAVLPFSAAPRVASIVMGQDPWRSGMALMAFDNPTSWGRLVDANRLVEANSAEIIACRKSAATSGKAQPCSITVPADQ